MNKKSIKISLVFNIIIFLLTAFASFMMFTGIKFSTGYEPILETTKIGILKFFTVQSNLFMGVVALIFSIKEIQLLKGKKDDISKKYYILKLMSTTAVFLTFFVVFSYLGLIADGGLISLLRNSNLFFHLIIPVLSIITFICFDKTNKLRIKDSLYGVIPTILYVIYYTINVLTHIENGKVSPKYDWYYFVQNGIWTAFIVTPMMLVISYLLSLLLWKLNKNNSNRRKK